MASTNRLKLASYPDQNSLNGLCEIANGKYEQRRGVDAYRN